MYIQVSEHTTLSVHTIESEYTTVFTCIRSVYIQHPLCGSIPQLSACPATVPKGLARKFLSLGKTLGHHYPHPHVPNLLPRCQSFSPESWSHSTLPSYFPCLSSSPAHPQSPSHSSGCPNRAQSSYVLGTIDGQVVSRFPHFLESFSALARKRGKTMVISCNGLERIAESGRNMFCAVQTMLTTMMWQHIMKLRRNYMHVINNCFVRTGGISLTALSSSSSFSMVPFSSLCCSQMV